MRIGVDLGGTKIEALALSDAGEELIRRRVDTPAEYAPCLEAVAALVIAVEADVGETGTVGVATPGAESRITGAMKNSNLQFLNGRLLRSDLCRVVDREVLIANDADCLVLSEATDGAAAGCDPVFGAILGTGVGGGIVVGGRLVTGPNGIAGEWGHNPLPYPEFDHSGPLPSCYCGKAGCVEKFLSGPGMSADHERVSGNRISAREVAEAADRGDKAAVATVERYSSRLARALAVVINILDPEVIVLGGGVSNVKMLYETVPQKWDPFVFSDATATRLVANRHGDSSGVRGAAWLWPLAP